MKRRIAMAVVLAMGVAAAPAVAQGVVGYLYDFDTGAIVVTAEVVLTNEAGDTVGVAISDNTGRFAILVQSPGDYTLSVTRLGYVRFVSTGIELEEDDIREVEVTVNPDAVTIDGLVVSTRKRVRALAALGFYDRKKLNDRGNFIMPTDADRNQVFSTTGYLRSVPGIMVREGEVRTMRREITGVGLKTEPCLLKVLVNGMDMGVELDEVVRSRDVSAIEVYNSLSQVPGPYRVQAGRGYNRFVAFGPPKFERTCGAVLVWTRFGR